LWRAVRRIQLVSELNRLAQQIEAIGRDGDPNAPHGLIMGNTRYQVRGAQMAALHRTAPSSSASYNWTRRVLSQSCET